MAEEAEKGVVNCCCPYFGVAKCADTEEHRHIVCGAKEDVIANDYVSLYCVTDHEWGRCPIFAEECTIRSIRQN